MPDMPTSDPSAIPGRPARPRDPTAGGEAGLPPDGEGRVELGLGGPLDRPVFPLQLAKVQEPPLRESTLTRDRLLEWIRAKIHHRVILVTAEAGYGKTTLLADFSRRSRHRTLWYRLDEGDRSWAVILRYLIAAGREFVPSFAPVTAGLLNELGPNGPSRETTVEAFVREFGELDDQPGILVLDDVHLVDHADDAAFVLRAILERMPARLTLVLVSRRPPGVPLGRLRGQGEVAELTSADLRFDDDEIERLFRDSYQQPLEPDVLRQVSLRTEGWAASLELIHTAIRDRPPAERRDFITELSGSRGDVYDYLAEEIVAELPTEIQQFLMRTAILESLEPDLAAVATGLQGTVLRRRLDDVERLGLVSRRATRARGAHRYHPLVREFLETRLLSDIGADAVADLHRTVARAVESRDWATACRHFAAADDGPEIHRVVEAAIGRIMASGDYSHAESIIDAFPADPPPASHDIIRSRMELRRGSSSNAVELARRAASTLPTDAARMNLASVLFTSGLSDEAAKASSRAIQEIGDGSFREASLLIYRLIRTSLDESLADTASHLQRFAHSQTDAGNEHFAGVSLLNLSIVRMHSGEVEAALQAADEARLLLRKRGSLVELASAELAIAWAHAHLGQLERARAAYETAAANVHGRFSLEAKYEAAFVEVVYGDVEVAERHLLSLEPGWEIDLDSAERVRMARIGVAIRRGDLGAAQKDLNDLRFGELSRENVAEVRRLALAAQLAVASGSVDAHVAIGEAAGQAAGQGAHLWLRSLHLLGSAVSERQLLEVALQSAIETDPGQIAFVVEPLAARLADLGDGAFAALSSEVEKRPERWRDVLRRVVDQQMERRSLRAGQLLERIGTKDDVARLRRLARAVRQRGRGSLGIALARRLADRVFVEDQGRVILHVGLRKILGTEIRRKVLALLCYLLSRPGRSATRDEVLEALWPELEPLVALNSLNQTVYFLRRVFEPDYKEELSPGYVYHESDVVWLDPELVDSRSIRCAGLLSAAGRQRTWVSVDALSDEYRGKFALDFAYEEWAGAYRDSMHAGYLQVIESAISDDVEAGQYDHGIALARRAIEVDPEAEELELSLLRLYRGFGAAAAAAEQYSHYAAMLRDGLGVDPPPLEAL
jgi:ATP/maltotriose-dependent transcriptional regulator MalT/DNA-binding SARP family transcriptional activator